MAVRDEIGPAKTAFVFAGGGSFGAIQVGMLHSLAAHGIAADMVVGSSVGALNGAFYASDPTLDGVQRLAAVWRGLQRHDVFPMSWRAVLSFLWHRDFLISHDGIRKLIEDHIPYRNLEEAKVPVHIVTTDIVSGDSVVLSEGSTAEAIVASTAIAGTTSPIRYGIVILPTARSPAIRRSAGVNKGARRLIILRDRAHLRKPTTLIGARRPTRVHAMTLRSRGNWVRELEMLGRRNEHFVVPPLCPGGLPLVLPNHRPIDRAISPPTHGWRARLGNGRVPDEMRLHRHRPPLPDRYAALQKCSEESANISAIRCHIRERPPVYRMGLPHRLD